MKNNSIESKHQSPGRPLPELAAEPWPRRYDFDWLRIISLGLLMLFHSILNFEPFASGPFAQNQEPLGNLVVPYGSIYVWRTPLLYLVSGMGMRFAMQRRNLKQLLGDRTLRLLVPFVFGFFFIVPISNYLRMRSSGEPGAYDPGVGHLWFLANIFLYVLLLLPLMLYLKNRPGNILFRWLSSLFRWPVGIFLLALPLVLETVLLNPEFFVIYIMTVHGFWLGMVCFFTGFLLASMQDVFRPASERIRWVALAFALLLYLVRLWFYGTSLFAGNSSLLALESMTWMLAVLGFASRYLDRPSRALSYLAKAVYPVYIIHLPVQFTIAYFLLPRPLPASLKLIILLSGTVGVSTMLYEYVLKRLKWIRPLFGMKLRQV